MKKIVAVFLLIVTYSYSQNFKIEDKSITAIFTHDSVSKTDLFNQINKWIAKNYNSANNVIQMANEESGTFIVKGISDLTYRNIYKSLHPKNKRIASYYVSSYKHQLEINVKENKFRAIFTFQKFNDGTFHSPSPEDYIVDIKLTGVTKEDINSYKEIKKAGLKGSLIGKKKKEIYLNQIEPLYEEIVNDIVKHGKAILSSINTSVLKENEKRSDW